MPTYFMEDNRVHSYSKKKEVEMLDNQIFRWNGWTTTWGQLRREGWEIESRNKYDNWADPTNSKRSTDKLYIRHPKNKMIGRVSATNLYDYTIGTDTKVFRCTSFDLDFLIQEHNQRVSPPKILIESELTEQDIPQLMEMLLQLQSNKKPKKKPQPKFIQQAEILLLKQAYA